jgi:hypothetical protein
MIRIAILLIMLMALIGMVSEGVAQESKKRALYAQSEGVNPSNPGGAQYAPPPSMSDTASAKPSKHRASRQASQGKAPHHPSRFSNMQGNVANQLNQEELARLQAGNMSMPPAPPSPGMAPPNSAGTRMGR